MELGKMGPYHRVVTKFVALGPEEFLIAHRIFTHNIWSSTGVTNSVFVLVPGGLDLKRLNMGLDQLSKDNISFGTDDFCLILDGQASVDGKLGAAENYQNLLAAGKRFTFLVHDLSLNEELFYKDSDYQSS
jgi:hypothetical protein